MTCLAMSVLYEITTEGLYVMDKNSILFQKEFICSTLKKDGNVVLYSPHRRQCPR